MESQCGIGSAECLLFKFYTMVNDLNRTVEATPVVQQQYLFS